MMLKVASMGLPFSDILACLVRSCAAAGGDVPGQGFYWAPAVTAAVAGTLSAPVQEKETNTHTLV